MSAILTLLFVYVWAMGLKQNIDSNDQVYTQYTVYT